MRLTAKKVVTMTAVACMVGMLAVGNAWAGRVAKRQVRQQSRIVHGVHKGELTKREVRGLEKEQRRIQRSKRRAWSDGQLTRKERGKLELRQDRASYRIYRAKHNDRSRN